MVGCTKWGAPVRSAMSEETSTWIQSVRDEPPSPDEPPEHAGEPPATPVEEGVGKEGVWKEDYDDFIEPDRAEEETSSAAETRKPKKTRHWAGIITVIAIIVILVLWTLLSPKILPQEGMTYVLSPKYANLGNFTGSRNIWAGDMVGGSPSEAPTTLRAGFRST